MFDNLINLLKTSFINLIMKNQIDYSTWVFSSSYNRKFNYNSKYLFEYVINNEPSIQPLFVINDDDLRYKLQKKYGEQYFIETKSFKGIKRVLSSGVWFTSAGLPVYGLNLNKNRLIINLWHGVPLKKIALMENNLNPITRIYFKYIFSKNYSYVLTTSNKLVDIMKQSFDIDGSKVKVLGQPRNDAIFNKNDRKKILFDLYGELPNYTKIILYAPTFRDKNKTKFFPFADFNQSELNKFLNRNKLLLFIRCHQSELNNVIKIDSERVKFINEDKVEDIMDIINIFDLLITDYSSIYIDYLLTMNPVLFLPYDKNDYIKTRGLNFNYDEVTPGPKPNTFKNFMDEVLKLLNDESYYDSERKRVNIFFNEINRSCSAEICDFVKSKVEKFKI